MLDKDGLPLAIEGQPCDREFYLVKRTPYMEWIGDPNNPEKTWLPRYYLTTDEALEYLGICRRTLLRHANLLPKGLTYMTRNIIKYPNLYKDKDLYIYKQKMAHPDFNRETGEIDIKPKTELEQLKETLSDLQNQLTSRTSK